MKDAVHPGSVWIRSQRRHSCGNGINALVRIRFTQKQKQKSTTMLIRNPSCTCIQKCVEYTAPKVLHIVSVKISLLEVLLSNIIDQRETEKDLNIDFKQLSFCKIPYKNNI